MFKHLFFLQNKLMKRYVEDGRLPEYPLDLSKKENVKVFRECVFHIIQELFEVTEHLKNRPNRKTQIYEYNRESFKEEISDALHLFLEMMILSGIGSEEIYREYKNKNDTNHRRIDEGL